MKFKTNSISTKITTLIVFMLIISLCVLSGISYYNISKIVKKDTQEIMMTNLINAQDKVNLWISLRKAEVNTASQAPLLKSGDRAAAVSYLGQIAIANKDIYNKFFWTEPSGYTERTNGTQIFYDNVADRKYYQEPMKTGELITDVVFSRADGKLSLAIVSPVKKDNKIVGLVGGTVGIDSLINEISEIKVGQSGYVFMVDNSGTVIAHPDKQMVIERSNFLTDSQYPDDFKVLVQKMLNKETGIGKYHNLDNTEKYMVYMPVENMPWSIAVVLNTTEVDAPLILLKKLCAIITVVTLLLALFIAIYYGNKIVKPIPLLQNWATQIAAGNLTAKDLSINSKDELEELSNTFHAMTNNLNKLVSSVNNASTSVLTSSQQLAASAEQTAQTSKSVAEAISDVSIKTNEQFMLVTETSKQVNNVSTKINDIATNNNLLIEMSQKSCKATEDGNKAVNMAITQMNNIEKTTTQLSSVVNILGNKSKQINSIVSTISGIAGQTNLLALNAAIEAARAGEQGKGFAVVAEEVRKLAEQSQVAAKQIAELISEIENDTEQTLIAMQQGTEEVTRGTEIVKTASLAFQDINNWINQMTKLIEDSANAISTVAEDSTAIVATNTSFSNTSQQIAQHTETVSAATQEQLATIEEITAACQSLSHQAEKLNETVNKFII